MQTLPASLQASLNGGATTLCYCWRITRADGLTMGFTEHDENLIVHGDLYEAASGFTPSQISKSLGLAVDNFTAQGALSSLKITEADLLAGLYDNAQLMLLWVDWSNPSSFITVSTGNLGEIKREGLTFTAEFRSLSALMNQKQGHIFQRTCSASLGDARCKVDLSVAKNLGQASVTAVTLGRATVTGLQNFAAEFFNDGLATIQRTGVKLQVKAFLQNPDQSSQLEFWTPARNLIVGDVLSVTAGCLKTFSCCLNRFANTDNFRGFPHIPSSDVITDSAGGQNQQPMTGGSRFS